MKQAARFTDGVMGFLEAAEEQWKKEHPKEELPATKYVLAWVFARAKVPLLDGQLGVEHNQVN